MPPTLTGSTSSRAFFEHWRVRLSPSIARPTVAAVFHQQMSTHIVRFDHLQHWVPDLNEAIAAYRRLGFPIEIGGRHPGRGTHNAQWESRPHFIELIAVRDRDEAMRGWGPSWPQINGLLEVGGGAGRFAVEVEDLAPIVARLRADGFTDRDPLVGTIALPDGTTVSWSLAPMTGAPAWAPFFTNYGDTPEERQRGRERAASPWQVKSLRIETADVASAAA